MKKFLILAALLFVCVAKSEASDEYFESACSSFTSIATSSMTMVVSSRAYAFDGISVIYPGSASFVEVWDWAGSTIGAQRYLGKYDTTSKVFHHEGKWGVPISTNVMIYNQGTTPAGIKVFWRSTAVGVCRPVY